MPSSRERVLNRAMAATETAEQRAARQVAAAYNQARRELLARLLEGWTGTSVMTPEDAARLLRQSGLLQQIDARLLQLEREVGITLRGIVTDASERALEGIRREMALLPAALRPSDLDMFSTINSRMIEQFVPPAMADWRSLTTGMSNTLQRELQTGLIQGESFPSLATRLLRQAPGDGPGAVFPRAQTSADLATRRLVIAAENGAKQAAIAETAAIIPEVRKQAFAVIGVNTTDCCLRIHGQIQPVDAPFELVGEPRFADRLMTSPFHWNCRTAISMYHPAFEASLPTSKMQAAAAAELRRREEEKTGRKKRTEGGSAASRQAATQRDQRDDIPLPSVAPSSITPNRPAVVLESDGVVAQRHLQDYNRIPVALRDAAEAKGVQVYINNDKTLPDIDRQEAFRGVRPRGWAEGATWDIVPGAYSRQDRYVIAGKGQSGSVSLLLHEYGHAAGHVLGYDNDTRLIALHKRQYARLDSYLQQGGPGGQAGRQEFLAEAFAHTFVDRATAISRYGQDMIDFIENVVSRAGKAQIE